MTSIKHVLMGTAVVAILATAVITSFAHHSFTAEFDPVVPEVLQLVQDDVEVVGRGLLVEQVRPGSDRDSTHGPALP